MESYKIRVNNLDESKEAQRLLFELGYAWKSSGKSVMYVDMPTLFADSSGRIYYACTNTVFETLEGKELTLPQLRDMVVLHRNDVNDANYVGNICGYFYVTCEGNIYVWDGIDAWGKSKYTTMDNIKPIHSVPKQGLISGADALRALANGEEVEYEASSKVNNWRNVSETIFEYKEILQNKSNTSDVSFRFRLKPRTITINGIEVPAPFKPKDGERFFYINPNADAGYGESRTTKWSKYIQFGAWRTEEDVKQVVEALRGALKNG